MNNEETQFKNWLDTFIAEKNIGRRVVIDTDKVFEVENTESIFGNDFVPFAVVVEFVMNADASVRANVKQTIVNIDFFNGDVMDFFAHMAKGIVMARMIEG